MKKTLIIAAIIGIGLAGSQAVNLTATVRTRLAGSGTTWWLCVSGTRPPDCMNYTTPEGPLCDVYTHDWTVVEAGVACPPVPALTIDFWDYDPSVGDFVEQRSLRPNSPWGGDCNSGYTWQKAIFLVSPFCTAFIMDGVLMQVFGDGE